MAGFVLNILVNIGSAIRDYIRGVIYIEQ